MAPVILKMDGVHCERCADKIRKAIQKMFGLKRVWVSPDTGLVVIDETADAMALRRRLRRKTGKSVTIVSDGTPADDVPFVGMTHLAPPAAYGAPPPGYPPYYTWAPTPPLPPPPYVAAPAGYLYAGNPWAPTQNQYVPGGTPTSFVDDDDTSDGCCSMQ